jgi:hypothetical protein
MGQSYSNPVLCRRSDVRNSFGRNDNRMVAESENAEGIETSPFGFLFEQIAKCEKERDDR